MHPLCLVMAAWLMTPVVADDRDAIAGRWLNQEGLAVIEIARAGEVYEGRIVWLKEATYPAGDPKGMGGRDRVDRDNPDPALRSRRLLGLVIMRGFRFDGGRSWSGGRLYDPQSGKEYRGRMTLASPDTLSLRGYVGIPLFGRTSTWTRQKS
jgi:uncharacterized protein (DUF2147 family)